MATSPPTLVGKGTSPSGYGSGAASGAGAGSGSTPPSRTDRKLFTPPPPPLKPVEYPDAFLRAIPKTDVHVHLDGSLRLETLIELAREGDIELPAYTVEGLREKVFKDSYESLEEYLVCFQYTTAVMRTAANLERISYEFAVDCFTEGVRYFEVRFAPQLHAGAELTIEDVLVAVNTGLQRAKKEYNAHDGVVDGTEPPYAYGIIVSALRSFFPGMSPYYAKFLEVHEHEPRQRIYGLASAALVSTAIHMRDERGLPIVALDVAGAERGFPARYHKDAYALAHKATMSKTVHAGEGYGPESIFQAITDCHAQRIGHGFHLFSVDKVEDDSIEDKEAYVSSIVEYVAANRIQLEVCLTSNLQTMPSLKNDLANHAFRRMLDYRLSLSLNTDNRLVSNTTLTKELRLAVDNFKLTPRELKDVVIGGFKRSFMPMKYPAKRVYTRHVLTYYDSLCEKYNVPTER